MIKISKYGHSNTRNCCYYRILTEEFQFNGFKTNKLQVVPMKAIQDIFCIEGKTKLDKFQLRNFKLELFKCSLRRKRF